MWREGNRVILEPAVKSTWPEGYWDEMDQLAPLVRGECEVESPGLLDLELD